MKKLLAILLALALAQGLAFGEDILLEGEGEAAELPRIPEGTVVYDHLSVGNPTPMRGEFFTDMWGNATSDIDVRDLLHGYNLVVWDVEFGHFTFDPSVVTDAIAMVDAETGDHSYLITLQNDLYYSDGTLITAWDYAFSWLLSIAPEIAEIGGLPQRKAHLLGYQAYVDGDAPALAGVSVPADNVLLVTLDHEFLPFFFEIGLLMCNPYPIGVIAPGVTVRDDGQGVYLDGAFSAELLRRTILDPVSGYMSHPSVVSGPYTLTSWDGVTAEFAINPYYKGNTNGVQPVIGTLSYTTALNADMMDRLADGTFGLLDKVTRGDVIDSGLDLSAGEGFDMSNYPRIGLSYISFACEKPTVASQAVRQAIAWCVDRDEVMRDYTGNYGIRVDGYYGVGQWMYGLVMGTTAPPLEAPAEGDTAAQREYEEALLEWEALSFDELTVYTLDTARAAALLDEDGWTLNADGLREKQVDGQTVTLDLHMIYPEGNRINEIFEERLVPNLAAVGIRLSMEAVPMQQLLTRWYKQGERDEDMIYLASNFELLFDPSVNFVQNEEGQLNWSYTNHVDEELTRLADETRCTEPGAVLEYMHRWLAFQDRFNETLPMLPFYSNIYFDFYTADLHDFHIPEAVTWGEAIVESALYEAPELPEAEEPETADESGGPDL